MIDKNINDSIIQKIINILDKEQSISNKLLGICQILNSEINYYDWVGFYLVEDEPEILVLGPYVGAHTDHTHIPFGKGVCGQVAESKETFILQDVSQEGNYLSCSIDVQSEIVVPIIKDGIFIGELDIDSHAKAPFDENDRNLLEEVCKMLAKYF